MRWGRGGTAGCLDREEAGQRWNRGGKGLGGTSMSLDPIPDPAHLLSPLLSWFCTRKIPGKEETHLGKLVPR